MRNAEEKDCERNMVNYNKSELKIGSKVRIVQKQDQRSGTLTEGVVQRILTKSPAHPHGIKVMLENGLVGRVKEIL
ncbi:YwbE family protein [Acidaminobacter sp.]|uniref:YwbE family protein n=2 Tax=Acidaminobacter sp. TaxID=1872102 RepID=UPI002ED4B2AC